MDLIWFYYTIITSLAPCFADIKKFSLLEKSWLLSKTAAAGADGVYSSCCCTSCIAAGDVLRGDDDAAGWIRDADGLPAEQLQGAAAAVHGTGVLLLHRHRGSPHTRYVSKTLPSSCLWDFTSQATASLAVLWGCNVHTRKHSCDIMWQETLVALKWLQTVDRVAEWENLWTLLVLEVKVLDDVTWLTFGG